MNRREFLKKLALSPVALAVGLEIAADIIREEGPPPGPELKEAIESCSYTQNNYVIYEIDGLIQYEYMAMRALSATS